MDGPSVRGSVFGPVACELGYLVQTSQLGVDALERALKPEDLPHLRQPAVPTRWYPVGAYARCVELLGECEGPESLAWRGAAMAEEVLGRGARLIESARDWGSGPFARALLNLGAQLYSFLRWELDGSFEDGAYAVDANGAEAFPEVLRTPTASFLARLHGIASGRVLSVTSERPVPERLRFELSVRPAARS